MSQQKASGNDEMLSQIMAALAQHNAQISIVLAGIDKRLSGVEERLAALLASKPSSRAAPRAAASSPAADVSPSSETGSAPKAAAEKPEKKPATRANFRTHFIGQWAESKEFRDKVGTPDELDQIYKNTPEVQAKLEEYNILRDSGKATEKKLEQAKKTLNNKMAAAVYSLKDKKAEPFASRITTLHNAFQMENSNRDFSGPSETPLAAEPDSPQ